MDTHTVIRPNILHSHHILHSHNILHRPPLLHSPPLVHSPPLLHRTSPMVHQDSAPPHGTMDNRILPGWKTSGGASPTPASATVH